MKRITSSIWLAVKDSNLSLTERVELVADLTRVPRKAVDQSALLGYAIALIDVVLIILWP